MLKILKYFKINRLIILLACTFLSSVCFASSTVEGIQVYQKNTRLSPEHKQKIADDIDRYRHADNIWNVLREEFTLPHYEDSPAVQEKIEWYMNNQDFLLRSANRAAPYLYYILQQVKKRHLPAELVLLPIIESGYNPLSLSTAGAAGIWQLMPATAAGLGVKQDWWYDGRRDVITSTRAALNHLAYLQSVYEGNWLLALAAYDTGEGNLHNAIVKNIRNGLDTDFWSLPLSAETRNYVPSLLALAVIISHPDQYPIYFPPVKNAPYLAQVDVGSQINLKYAASLAGLSHKRLMQLNSGYSKPSTSTRGPFKLVLPIENVEQFTENLVRSPLNTQINWQHYRVNSGDTIVSIAKKFRTTPEAIRKLNQLSKNAVRRGTTILIPTHATPKSPEETVVIASKNSSKKSRITIASTGKYHLQPGDTIYMVRSSDTIESVARHFNIDTASLRSINKIKTANLTPGKQLVIPTHAAGMDNGLQPGDTLYMVRRGDTIENIAYKFHTTPAAIRLSNLLSTNSVQEGERIVVPTHLQG